MRYTTAITATIGLALAAIIFATWRPDAVRPGSPPDPPLPSVTAPPADADADEGELDAKADPGPPDNDPGWQVVSALADYARAGRGRDKLEEMREAWPPKRVYPHLGSKHEQIRHSTILMLMFLGDKGSITPLVACLRDDADVIRRLGEMALRSLWGRLGTDESNRLVAEAAALFTRGQLDDAMKKVDAAIELTPDFAEAYHVRAMIHLAGKRFDKSAEDCGRAVKLLPEHFAAWYRLGTCLEALGQTAEALDAYRKARDINPALPLDRKIEQLEGASPPAGDLV